jgi:hypothetical protein
MLPDAAADGLTGARMNNDQRFSGNLDRGRRCVRSSMDRRIGWYRE